VRDGEFKPGELLPGTRYRVVGLLGAGGMGLVYDVEHVELGKRFVLKALLSDLAGRDDIVARLRNEQRALGRLQHPNIVAVTDAGVTSTSLPFFVMERLEGETLGARLKKCRRLPVVEAITVARGVLDGLSAAHEIGVVHRDIKPQNIFLASGNGPKILDFGVAKIADAAGVITARGFAIGTPRYMSPEQVRGEGVDGRSDLYAVGLLLFETIVGRGPFDDAHDANEMLLAHLGKPAPRLGGMAAGVSRELDALVASLLSKPPGDRPATARAASAALVAVLARYGGRPDLEARTPLASYSSPTQPLFVPESRHPVTQVEATTRNPTTELLANTGVGRGPGGTLFDSASRALTVANPDFVVPPDAVRTERLGIAGLHPAPGDDPTRTRAPLTPSDAAPSLAPVRVEGSRAPRGRPVALFAVAALLALFALAYVLARGEVTSTASAPAGALRSSGADREPSQASKVAALPNAAVSSPEPARVSVSEKARAPATPEVTPPEAPALRPTSPPKPVPSASASAPPTSGDERRAVPSNRAPAASAVPPPGLPGSGL
jgi:serine/threonine-protein kinase